MSDFEFKIQDIFTVPEKGTIIAGRVLLGKICTGDKMYVPTSKGKVEVTILEIKDKMCSVQSAAVSFEPTIIGLRIGDIQDIITGKASSHPDSDDK